MRVAIGTDHAGFELKEKLKRELEILGRTRHYGATLAIEALLQDAGMTPAGAVSPGGSARLRRDYFHAALDRIFVETKIERRRGGRADLGRYDERFAGFYVSWVPMETKTPEGRLAVRGAPHLILIEYRGGPGPTLATGGVSAQPPDGTQYQFRMSGLPIDPPR